MLRPLIVDVLETLLPCGAGVLAFLAGMQLRRLPRGYRRTVIVLAFGVAILAWPAYLWREEWFAPLFCRIGSVATPALWAVLLLLGVTAALPSRTLSTRFLAVLLALLESVLLLEGGGQILWRFGFPEIWNKTADAQGQLQQTLGVTCSPAAAVMLLHHHGITTSEGEMAYRANTSIVGTNLHSMAGTVDDMVRQHGWSARVEQADAASLVDRDIAFLASAKIPGVGSHALFVERLTSDHADLIDPLEGRRQRVGRAQFERWWDRKIIRIVCAE